MSSATPARVRKSAEEEAPPDRAIEAMGHAYVELLSDSTALQFQMQSYAACSDPVIQARVRDRFGRVLALVTRVSDAPPETIWQFFSHGMLLNVLSSLDLPAIAAQEPWAAAWCEPGELIRLT